MKIVHRGWEIERQKARKKIHEEMAICPQCGKQNGELTLTISLTYKHDHILKRTKGYKWCGNCDCKYESEWYKWRKMRDE